MSSATAQLLAEFEEAVRQTVRTDHFYDPSLKYKEIEADDLRKQLLEALARSERTFSDREAILKREERERADKARNDVPPIHRAEWDGTIRFESDCIVNGYPVKAGTSWGPFEKSRNPERATNTRNIAESDPVFARALLREAFAWGLDLRHKAGCTWAVPASNFQKGTACNCGRDDLKKRLNDFAFHHVEVADARSSTAQLQPIPASIMREIERCLTDAEHPKGMSTHDGKARIDSSKVRLLLKRLDIYEGRAPNPYAGTSSATAQPEVKP